MTRFWSRHVSHDLARYCDGQLPPGEAARIQAHLAGCERCQAAHDDIVFASQLVRRLAIVPAPPDVWQQLEKHLPSPSQPAIARWASPRVAVAWGLALITALSAGYWFVTRPDAPPWLVAVDGSAAATTVPAGEWIDTGNGSRARIVVGEIGTVDVEPGTRIRLGANHPAEYRLMLERGSIAAEITAPPRLFVVDTPVGTVVDLGCAYTVTVDEDGGSELRMTQGWAALEWEGRESLVPAGAICRTRRGHGPGLPFFDDAPPVFKTAAEAFDTATEEDAAVGAMLRDARPRDTLTLWHLMARVNADTRATVYDRIAALVDIPVSISRDRALALDRETMTALREELAWSW